MIGESQRTPRKGKGMPIDRYGVRWYEQTEGGRFPAYRTRDGQEIIRHDRPLQEEEDVEDFLREEDRLPRER